MFNFLIEEVLDWFNCLRKKRKFRISLLMAYAMRSVDTKQLFVLTGTGAECHFSLTFSRWRVLALILRRKRLFFWYDLVLRCYYIKCTACVVLLWVFCYVLGREREKHALIVLRLIWFGACNKRIPKTKIFYFRLRC